MEKFGKARVETAMSVFDRAKDFATQFPHSTHFQEIQGPLIENLFYVFGAIGLPIPRDRAPELETWIRRRIVDAPGDSRLSMILVRVAQALPPPRKETVLTELSQESTPEPARTQAAEALRTYKRLGRPLELKFTALDGRVVDLATLKGKVVLIDFWSTTCVPCVREMPDLKKLYTKSNPQGFEVIGITLDEDKNVLQRFIQKEQLTWPQYYDPKGSQNPLAQEFFIRSIPVVWLVDRHGVLRHLDGREDQERKIEELLKEN